MCVLRRTVRDARIKKTLSLLKQGLIDLMRVKQTNRITIKELCEKAQVTRQTFYLHFSDLDEYIHYVSDEVLDDFRRKVSIGESRSNTDFMDLETHTSFIRIFEHILDNQAFYESLLMKNSSSPFALGFKKEINHFITDGLQFVAPDDSNLLLPREVVIHYTTAAFFEVVIWWIENGYPYPKEEMAKMLLTQSIKGPYK